MNLRRLFKFPKYLGKIFLWFTMAILLIVIVFSVVIYFTSERILLKNEYETSKKILYQVKYNIDLIDTTIKNLCKELFVNPDIVSLMYEDYNDSNEVDLVLKTNRLTKSFEMTNLFLHSVTIYNSTTKQYYNLSSNISIYFDDTDLKNIFKKYPDLPRLKPILRKIKLETGNGDQYENVFTYILYETPVDFGKMDSTIIVNVKSKWLLDNIKMINMIEKNKEDSIFLLDESGELISSENSNDIFGKSLKDKYLTYKKSVAIDTSFFECELDDDKYVVTYLYLENEGWTLLKVQPDKEVFGYLNTLKETAVVVTCFFLFLAGLISLTISQRLYKPLGILIKHVTSRSLRKADDEDSFKDEISFLDNVYKDLNNKVEVFTREQYQNKGIMKSYWIKRLIKENESMGKELFEEITREYGLVLPYEGCFTVCVIKIDNLEHFKMNNTLKDRELLRFAVINISAELVSEKYLAEGVDMGEDHVALIVCLNNMENNYLDSIESILKRAQELINQYIKLSVTAAIGNKVDSISSIHESYNHALKISMYRFITGKKYIITPLKVKENLQNENMAYSPKLEAKLVESIKSANMKTIKEALDEISGIISVLNYDQIVIFLINLVSTIWRAVDDTMKSQKKNLGFDFVEINRAIFGLETKNEFFELLISSLKNVVTEEPGDESNSKNKAIVKTVIDIIDKNYNDSALCFNQIAGMLKIYPRRLARIFKESEDVSIPEYINNLRLDKAAELLKDCGYNVGEVIEKVGIDNETYFYSIFKKKFGTTPKEYALRKHLHTFL